jgi:hypothetical protein
MSNGHETAWIIRRLNELWPEWGRRNASGIESIAQQLGRIAGPDLIGPVFESHRLETTYSPKLPEIVKALRAAVLAQRVGEGATGDHDATAKEIQIISDHFRQLIRECLRDQQAITLEAIETARLQSPYLDDRGPDTSQWSYPMLAGTIHALESVGVIGLDQNKQPNWRAGAVVRDPTIRPAREPA